MHPAGLDTKARNAPKVLVMNHYKICYKNNVKIIWHIHQYLFISSQFIVAIIIISVCWSILDGIILLILEIVNIRKMNFSIWQSIYDNKNRKNWVEPSNKYWDINMYFFPFGVLPSVKMTDNKKHTLLRCQACLPQQATRHVLTGLKPIWLSGTIFIFAFSLAVLGVSQS